MGCNVKVLAAVMKSMLSTLRVMWLSSLSISSLLGKEHDSLLVIHRILITCFLLCIQLRILMGVSLKISKANHARCKLKCDLLFLWISPVVWVVCSEIFPTRIRAMCLSVTTAFNWVRFICKRHFLYSVPNTSYDRP